MPIMRYLLLALFAFSALCSVSALAREMDYSLMREAVIYAAQVDAYNIYCESDSALAQNFLDVFETEDYISRTQYESLRDLKIKGFSLTHEKLTQDKVACDDVNFMLSRLELMRILRDVSYRLNGIDPDSVPMPEMPALEDMLPPPRDVNIPPAEL